GAELIVETPAGAKIPVFTTRPDTVFGATYLVLAPEHPLVDQLIADEQRRQVNAYRREVQGKDLVSRRVGGGGGGGGGDKTKTGVFLGSYARNPATGEAIPIWIADYVLMDYGTGAIMGVPAHDRRDFEFATQFKLPIRPGGRGPGGLHKGRDYVGRPHCRAQGRRGSDASAPRLGWGWCDRRPPSGESEDRRWAQERTTTWRRVTSYIGGNEHAVLHLLYS